MKEDVSSILLQIEEVYGLGLSLTGCKILDLDVEQVLKHVTEAARGTVKEKKQEMNGRAGQQVVLLSYLTRKIQYYEKQVLDFSTFSHEKQLLDAVKPFEQKNTVTREAICGMNRIAEQLAAADKKNKNEKYSLSYRTLRAFLVLVLFNNYYNASVLASFVEQQMRWKNDNNY